MLGQKYFLAEAAVVAFGQAASWDADMKQGDGADKPKTVEFELARRDTELVINEDELVVQDGRAIEALVVQGPGEE